MAVTIEAKGRGKFRIGIGDHRTHVAASMQEVVYALEHYFREPVLGYSNAPSGDFWANHLSHAKECSCCPLCRENQEA